MQQARHGFPSALLGHALPPGSVEQGLPLLTLHYAHHDAASRLRQAIHGVNTLDLLPDADHQLRPQHHATSFQRCLELANLRDSICGLLRYHGHPLPSEDARKLEECLKLQLVRADRP
jgi:hypothetical protein